MNDPENALNSKKTIILKSNVKQNLNSGAFLPMLMKAPSKTRSSSTIELNFTKQEIMLKPKKNLKSAFEILNNFESKDIKISPSLYLSEFELSLLEDCQEKYNKIIKELNEVRSN